LSNLHKVGDAIPQDAQEVKGMSNLTGAVITSVANGKRARRPSRFFYCRMPFVQDAENSRRGEANRVIPNDGRTDEALTGGSHLRSKIYIALASLLGLWLVLFAVGPKARAQEDDHYHPGHAKFHNIYKGWMQSNGVTSCCNGDDPEFGRKGDCHPARAYLDPDDNHWRVLLKGKWLIVPPEAVRPYSTPDGNSHVCEDDLNGIMCFVGGQPKS
jgi:hypothetical protein